ncbi:MAG: hypothetical protein ACOYXT_06420 [Bacteroidota bacterium]
MKIFREKISGKIMIFFTGLTFLNMSFFLVEVTALKLGKYKNIAENIARLVSGAAAEEESDGCNETEDATAKEVDLLIHNNLNHHALLFLSAQKRNDFFESKTLHPDHLEPFSPPPEV